MKKYIIVGYTSDINIRKNTARIVYAKLYYDRNKLRLFNWTDNVKEASKIDSKNEADSFIEDMCFKDIKAISYGIE